MSTAPITFDVHGRTVQELRGGTGRPLLYLHGLITETVWLPHLTALSAQRELHAPAHPGFAGSTGLDDMRDIEDLVHHYLAYMDALGWESVDVIGLSFGGWIAAELAARYPARVGKLALVSSVGIRLADTPIRDVFVADIRFPERVLETLFHDTSCPMAVLMRSMMGIEVADELIIDVIKARAAVAKVGWNPLLHDPRLPELLPRVTAPTLCLWGDDDRIVPTAYGRRFAELIPDARLEVVPACGHLVPMEQPQAFVAAIAKFFGAEA